MEYIYYPKGLEGRDYFTPKRSLSKEEFCISKNFTIPKLKYFEFFFNGKKVMAKLTLMVDLMDYLLIKKRPYNKYTFIWVMLPMLRKRLWHMYILFFHFSKNLMLSFISTSYICQSKMNMCKDILTKKEWGKIFFFSYFLNDINYVSAKLF